jgi:hypothetical protein
MALVELSDEEVKAIHAFRLARKDHADEQPQIIMANVTGRELRSISELMEASGQTHDEIVALAIANLRDDNLFGI